MKTRFRTVLIILSVASVGQGRSFVKVVDSTAGPLAGAGSIGTYAGAAINDIGTVAFDASAYEPAVGGSRTRIYTARLDTPDAATAVTAADDFAFTASINDNGTVAAYGGNSGGTVFVSANNAPAVAAYSAGSYGVTHGFGVPAINDNGRLAVFANGDADFFGLASGDVSGGPVTPLALYPEFNGVRDPAINNNNRIVTAGPRQGVGYGVHVVDADGGPVTTVVSSPTADFDYVAINDDDRLAYRQYESDGGGGSRQFIYTSDLAGNRIAVADTDGAYADLAGGGVAAGIGGLALNDAGAVAFFAALDAGGSGIFTGPDPVADKVIAVGDPLFGGTVTGLTFGREGLAGDGTIAFGYRLLLPGAGTEIYGIAVSPVPEPAVTALAAGAAGLLRRRRRPAGPATPGGRA